MLPWLVRLASYHGRAGRREFSLLATLLIVAELELIRLQPHTWEGAGFWLGIAAFMTPILLGSTVVVRRIHDLDWPAMIAYLFAVAVKVLTVIAGWFGLQSTDELGLVMFGIAGLYLAIAPGSERDNDFGPTRAAGT